MNIIYISRSKTGKPHPFVAEQGEALMQRFPVTIEHFLIRQGGVTGYLKALVQLVKFADTYKADIIHVHYGLSAIVAILYKYLLLKGIKIIITFHGSDINKRTERPISLLAANLSAHNILVYSKMVSFFRNNYTILPCGIDTEIELGKREITRFEKQWSRDDFVVLFSSSFDRDVKDPGFAFDVLKELKCRTTKQVKLIELKGYTRAQLTCIMQAADALLLCSKSEGSPQVIKEAVLNTLPVVANDVGDVREITEGVDTCFIVPKNIDDYVKVLCQLADSGDRIRNRRLVIMKYDNRIIAEKLYRIYCGVLHHITATALSTNNYQNAE